MKLRPNRIREREAMNAARLFFEAQGCVFQEVDAANDYGKDAYLDIVEELQVTGLCVALQVKGGRSYRTRDGSYRLPVDEAHALIWARSTVPVLGIVHDERENSLHWGEPDGSPEGHGAWVS